MSLPPEAQRKINQLDNDVQSIYGMLADINATQKRHGMRLDEMDVKLDGHTAILGEHTAILGEHTRVLGEHSRVLGEHGTKLDEILSLLRGRQ